MLHASQLELTHPFTGQPLIIQAGLDETWMQALTQFGWRGLLPDNERVEFTTASRQDESHQT
nr:RNA pseudouridylate synthase [Salmonella sp. NCTC 7297]